MHHLLTKPQDTAVPHVTKVLDSEAKDFNPIDTAINSLARVVVCWHRCALARSIPYNSLSMR